MLAKLQADNIRLKFAGQLHFVFVNNLSEFCWII